MLRDAQGPEVQQETLDSFHALEGQEKGIVIIFLFLFLGSLSSKRNRPQPRDAHRDAQRKSHLSLPSSI